MLSRCAKSWVQTDAAELVWWDDVLANCKARPPACFEMARDWVLFPPAIPKEDAGRMEVSAPTVGCDKKTLVPVDVLARTVLLNVLPVLHQRLHRVLVVAPWAAESPVEKVCQDRWERRTEDMLDALVHCSNEQGYSAPQLNDTQAPDGLEALLERSGRHLALRCDEGGFFAVEVQPQSLLRPNGRRLSWGASLIDVVALDASEPIDLALWQPMAARGGEHPGTATPDTVGGQEAEQKPDSLQYVTVRQFLQVRGVPMTQLASAAERWRKDRDFPLPAPRKTGGKGRAHLYDSAELREIHEKRMAADRR
jgi:hypothetical protein